MPDNKYDGPFESQEEEDAALKRSERIRERIAAKAKAEADADKAKKKKGDLPVVD